MGCHGLNDILSLYFLRRSSYGALITQVQLGAGSQFEVGASWQEGDICSR